LRAIVAKALSANMTRDVVNRAIARGAGGDDDKKLDELTYEGYGIGGVAVLVETMTDNLNRTVSDVRHAFSKHGGNLGTNGSVAYLFTKRGEIFFPAGVNEDKVMEVALESGADDVQSDEDGVTVITTPEAFGAVLDALEAASLKPESSEVTMSPSTQSEITDVDQAEKIMKMIDMLEDLGRCAERLYQRGLLCGRDGRTEQVSQMNDRAAPSLSKNVASAAAAGKRPCCLNDGSPHASHSRH
jgi:YebC/PmpR family DNA-binding regulatory protein